MNSKFYILLYLFTILILVLYNLQRPRKEYMEDNTNENDNIIQNDSNSNYTDADLNTFQKRAALMKRLRDRLTSSHEVAEQTFDDIVSKRNEDTTFDDDLFKNAKFYDFKEGEEQGIDKCFRDCNGNCLEYGITGLAWCFSNEPKKQD